jgi:uncharacterized membrane protein
LFFEIKEINIAIGPYSPFDHAMLQAKSVILNKIAKSILFEITLIVFFLKKILKLRILKSLFLDLTFKPLIQKWTLRSANFRRTM